MPNFGASTLSSATASPGRGRDPKRFMGAASLRCPGRAGDRRRRRRARRRAYSARAPCRPRPPRGLGRPSRSAASARRCADARRASRRRRGRRCRRRRNRGRASATGWRPPRAPRGRDWRSVPAAGRRSDRCCRASTCRLRSAGCRARACRAPDEAVDDRRVGLQPHPLVQAVDEHAGDMRTLVGLAGLPLDDRGQRDEFIGRLDRQVGAAARPDLLDDLALVVLHLPQDIVARVGRARPCRSPAAACLPSASRERRRSARRCRAAAARSARWSDPSGMVIGCRICLPADQRIHHVLQGRALLEQIFAGPQLRARCPRRAARCS